MAGMVLSIIAVVLLIAVGVSAVIRRRTAANAVMLFAFLLLAGLELFDRLALQPSAGFAVYRRISLWLESLLPAAFLLQSVAYRRNDPFGTLPRTRLGLMAALSLFPPAMLLIGGSDLSYSPDFLSDRVLFLGKAGYWYYTGLMASFIVSLANIEATLAATHGRDRNRVKFEAFGIMILLAVLVFYYSQGILHRTVDMNLVPVRSSVVIIAALLIGYSQAFRESGARVSVSRHVLYRSITLLAVGVYLIGLGLFGEGMQYFGVSFGTYLTVVLAFAGGVLLLAVLFSEKVRRRTKVYISKHFYSHKHDYREEWVKFTNRLASCKTLSGVQESVLTVYRETFGLGGASLYLLARDGSRYVRAAGQGMPEHPVELRISEDLRRYFAESERVLRLTDGEHRLSAFEDSSFRQAGAWLVVALPGAGKIEGLVLLREQIVPERLIYEDFDLMKLLARQAAQTVANLRLSEEVMEMRAMTAVSRISAFVIHDLKNLTSALSLVVDNAGEHIGNPDFQRDAIGTMKNTLAKMKSLTQRLKSIPEKIELNARVEDIGRLSRETVEDFSGPGPEKRVAYAGAPVFSRVDGEEIKKVIVNLVQNALEASSGQGRVTVETGKENGGVCIRVADAGAGMTEDFIKNHLFRPFSTTKEKGLGIGLYQCRQIVEAHAGRIEVKSEPGKGTVFTVVLPGAEPAPAER